MATVSEATTLPAEMGNILSGGGHLDEKKAEKIVTDEENGKSEGSVVAASVLEDNGESPPQDSSLLISSTWGRVGKTSLMLLIDPYTKEQYKKLKRRVDRYLLPLMVGLPEEIHG